MTRRDRSLSKREDKITEGSIADIARRRGDRIEAVMADAEMVVMLDISSSMSKPIDEADYSAWNPERYEHGEGYTRTRFTAALEALSAIQMKYQGKVLVIAFNSVAEFLSGGLPSQPSGGTNMNLALDLAKEFDDTDMKFTIISDGEPSNPENVIQQAKTFKTPIDTIFIGNDHDQRGLDVMNRIAAASRGKALGKVDPNDLGETTIKLLGGRS